MKKTVRRLLSTFLVILVTGSIVMGAISPLFEPSATVAQTNPQTTDIFTGQFLPAYFGAAYDPTEAYKHLAGAVVYVFAYDTWGNVVNDFAYKTQVRADGSFQAAGLPNASHYGVFFPNNINKTSKYFRTPKAEDNLQTAFAYQQAVYPEDREAPRIQINGQRINGEDGNGDIKGTGETVFLTSSRTADIANHINVFPLVPTNVLSVIIKDSSSDPDYANINKPYEIYAQRVASAALPTGEVPAECAQIHSIECGQTATESVLTNGPVIRGRTVYYTPEDDSGPCGQATIFQAFAPAGTYAITYWRPDGRDAQEQITYLNFNGTQPLNSPYNGIAVEVVDRDSDMSTADVSTSKWGDLSSRCIRTEENVQTYWDAYPNSANLWGVLYLGQNGRTTTASSGATVTISDTVFKSIDPRNRVCNEASSNTADVLDIGIYIFSSCRSRSSSVVTRLSLQDTGQSGGGITPIDNIEVSVNSNIGPARKDLGIVTFPEIGASGQLELNGKAIANVWLDLIVDDQVFNNVALTDENGKFVIGANYFKNNKSKTYKVRIRNNLGSTAYREFEIDAMSVAMSKNGIFSLGTIALDKSINPVESYLANLNLNNIFSLFRINTVLADYDSQIRTPWTVSSSPFADEQWMFYIDTSNLYKAESYFTPQNYILRHVEIGIPQAYEAFINCLNSNDENTKTRCETKDNEAKEADSGNWTYTSAHQVFNMEDRLFKRNESESQGNGVVNNTDGDEYSKGIVTEDGYANNRIIAVALEPEKENIDIDLAYLVRLLGPGSVQFTLEVEFIYKHKSDEQTISTQENNNTVSGQENTSALPPEVLTAEWPIYISMADSGGFDVHYDQVELIPAEADACKDVGLFSSIMDKIRSSICKIVLGGIKGVTTMFNFLADYILLLDPLAFNSVTHFWNILRNIVNSLAVFILILAGVAIMLRYEPSIFNIKTVLVRLVLSLVLVNFSILIVQIAVDITNVLAYGGYKFLLSNIVQEHVSINGLKAAGTSLLAISVAAVGALMAMTGGIGILGVLLFFLALVAFFGYIILRIGIDYVLRLAVLWLCIIFAPVAFAARVLPGTQKYFARWRGLLIGTLVAQITVAFIIAMAIGMLRVGIAESGFFNSLLTLLLAFALFYYATKAPRQVAAMVGEDLTAGMENLTKSGLIKAKGLPGTYFRNRDRRNALQSSREKALGVEGKGIVARRFAVGLDSLQRRRSEGLAGLAGVNADEQNKIREEAKAQALKERESRLYRDKSEAYDNADEQEFKDKMNEQDIDLDAKLIRAENTELFDRIRTEKRKDAKSETSAEVFNEARRMWEPELLETKRQNAAQDKYDETTRQLKDLKVDKDYPGARENRKFQEDKKQDYARSDSTLGAVIEGAKFTDAKESMPIVNSGFNIDLNYTDREGNTHQIGDLGLNSSFRKGLDEQLKNVKYQGVRRNLYQHIQANRHRIGTSKGLDETIDSFAYEGKTGLDAWKQWYSAAGIKVPDTISSSDMKGRVITMLTTDAVKKSGVAGWENNIKRNTSQATGTSIPRDALFQVSGNPELQDPAVTIGYAPRSAADLGAAVLDSTSIPTNVRGEHIEQVQRAINTVRRAYEQLRDTGRKVSDRGSSPTLNEYSRAVGVLEEAGYRFHR